MKHFLEVDSIVLEFGPKRVLSDVYVRIETGRITGILGRNGSGKSSLMNIIYGELETNNKSIRLDGKVMLNGISNPGILRFLPQYSFIPKHVSIKRVFNDFELDFSQFLNEFPEFEKYYKTKLVRLSVGECRIVEIYSILTSNTMFCMLDEPFSQIMPVHLDSIKTIIEKEKKNKGIIVTDHLYKHVTEISDDLYVIANGKTFLTKGSEDLKTLGYTNK